jgi:hypothetical protein
MVLKLSRMIVDGHGRESHVVNHAGVYRRRDAHIPCREGNVAWFCVRVQKSKVLRCDLVPSLIKVNDPFVGSLLCLLIHTRDDGLRDQKSAYYLATL